MLDTIELSKLARLEVDRHFGESAIERIQVDPIEMSTGDPALRFRLVLRPGALGRLGGDALLDMQAALRRAVGRTGDPRRVLTQYAEQSELDALESDPD